jgi:hypothetical protein
MMKTFRVVTQVDDGEPRKENHKSVQDLRQINTWYVAKTMDEVWEAIALDRLDEGVELIAIIQENSVVII